MGAIRFSYRGWLRLVPDRPVELDAEERPEREGDVAEASEIVRTGMPLRYEAAEVFFEDFAKGEKWHAPLRVWDPPFSEARAEKVLLRAEV